MNSIDIVKKLATYQLIINRAISRNEYHIAMTGIEQALKINPVCEITQTLQNIIHHRLGKYDKSSQNLKHILKNADKKTLETINNLLATYDLPSDLTYYECMQEIYSKIRNKKIINISLLFIFVIVAITILMKLKP
jgi:tetratricopeptide (TPR) repeat protein